MKQVWLTVVVGAVVGAAGCGDDPAVPTDAAIESDAATPHDAGADGGRDASVAPTDAGSDAFVAPDAGPTTFRIESLEASGCTVVDVNGIIGDDRGPLALTPAGVLLSGDDATGLFGRDLTGSLNARTRDNLVSDLATGQLYLLAHDGIPLGDNGGLESGATTLTSLIAGLDDASQGATEVVLSTPIPITNNIGIFAGYGEVAIHDSSHLWVITLATGAVVDLGAVPVTPMYAETWAYWGVLERVGSAYSIVYVRDGVRRVSAADGTSTLLLDANLGDAAVFSVEPTLGRWYFHSESATDFTTLEESLAYCDATFDTSDGFSITALTGTNCEEVAADAAVGDDRGGLAVSSVGVFLGGDSGLGRWSLDLTDAVSSTPWISSGPTVDGLVTDLQTEEAWRFVMTEDESTSTLTLTGLVKLRDSSTFATLSSAISFGSGSSVVLLAGWGHLGVAAAGHLYVVEFDGTVTDAGEAAVSSTEAETWHATGVLEEVAGVYAVVAVRGNDIVRVVVPDAVETLASFTDLSDMASFTVSPTSGRWYFHHEGSSQFTDSTDEALGFCDAVLTHP